MFFMRLASKNMRVNRSIYLPFFLSMTFLVSINTIMQILITNKGMQELPSAAAARSLFSFGNVVIFIFTFIFSIYTNSFLLKQRKKELGLYNILGLSKANIRLIILWENLLSFLLTLVSGLVIGTIFSRLSFLILKKMSGFGEAFTYSIDPMLYVEIGGFFLIIYFLLFLWNAWQIYRMKPVELLQGTQVGEKEPKAKWFTAILGVLFLTAGYYISLTITSPLDAMSLFFVAVILVIAGTYALFGGTSIVILKLLKKNKKFYYQPKHFFSISNMMYRMKQNAAGLASISVLSTMVLVTVATTTSLYVGNDNLLDNRNPYDIAIIVDSKPEKWMEDMENIALQHDLEVTEANYYTMSSGHMFVETSDGSYQLFKQGDNFTQTELIYFINQSEYNRVTGEQINLKEKDVWIYSMTQKYPKDTISILGHEYNVTNTPKDVPFLPKSSAMIIGMMFIVTPDDFLLEEATTADTVTNQKSYQDTTVFLNVNGTKTNEFNFAQDVKEVYRQSYTDRPFSSKSIDARESKEFMGGFLFLGIILGTTFTLATALIIYYKQVSEGLQDKERFSIMQRVGMSQKEVKQIIHSQVIMVFFFPLALACLNLAFAFPIVSKLLLLFGLSNEMLFAITCISVVLVFFIIYLIMFSLTSKAYYKVVKRNI